MCQISQMSTFNWSSFFTGQMPFPSLIRVLMVSGAEIEKDNYLIFSLYAGQIAFSVLTLLVWRQKEIQPVNNEVMRCWHDYLSRARCK